MTKIIKSRRRTGRYVPKYLQKIPFNLREKCDYFEERALWDDWNDYRDGFRRTDVGRYGNKAKKSIKWKNLNEKRKLSKKKMRGKIDFWL